MKSSHNQISDARIRLGIYAMLIVMTVALSVAMFLNGRGDGAQASETTPTVNTTESAPRSGVAQNSYASVVSRVTPAVVTIRAERRVRAPQQHPFLDDPMLREFFGNRLPQVPRGGEERSQSGLGSGVIVNSDGYILTNHHVIDGAKQIKVQMTNNRTLDAKIIGSDAASDLAVLKVEAKDLPALPLGNSDEVRVGDVALAIGNPLGIGQTVTSGIISAKGRTTGLGSGFEDFIQTDAPINQGNSGGALINTNGELIGINSQILSPSGGNIGIGFAIPSNMAKSVMEQLIKTGKVRRSVLGIVVQNVDSDIAASLELKEERGAIISSVQPGSAAERAGLKQGDIITRFNGTVVEDSNSFRNRVASTTPGTNVTLTIIRDGREQQLTASLGERPDELSKDGDSVRGTGDRATAGGKLGISVEPLTPEVAAQLRLPGGTRGLLVREVESGGPAAEAGLTSGDVIVEVNRQAVGSIEQLQTALQRTAGRPALMLINRRGETTLYLTVRPRS